MLIGAECFHKRTPKQPSGIPILREDLWFISSFPN